MADVAKANVGKAFDGLGAGVYIYGEVHKVWDRQRDGEFKYYVRLLIEDDPGTAQVNITGLSADEIRYLADHVRDNVLLRVRCFAMEGSLYYKALELITDEAITSSASVATSILSTLASAAAL